MKFARFGEVGAEVPAVEHEGTWRDLTGITQDINGEFLGSDNRARVSAALTAGDLPELDGATAGRTGAPIARPGKVICIGLNYRDHVEETGAQTPEEPVVFMKDPDTVIGPHDSVRIPRLSKKTDWEVELGVVIGKTARYLDSPLDAQGCVAGYALSNDISEREFQLERGGQWDKGKSCETFNPLGPWLVTPDEVGDPQGLAMSLHVNGKQRQNGSTANMIFTVDHIVWYLSQFMVLRPGDLINTGTPAGVALGEPDEPFLRAGDVMELKIDHLGDSRQELIAS